MKLNPGFLLLCASLAFGAQARAAVLPDACGDDKIKFDVTTQKGQPAPPPPASGKAQIVFIENENQMIGPFMYATVRFGLDGAWVGADNSNSYFALDVAPGLHHLCANWQGKKNFDLTPIIAKPGQVYYFAAQVTVESQYYIAFSLSQLNDDQGKYRVKVWKHSTSKPKPQQD
ncbi:MAG TPA: hypothetical protein VGT08_02265 [Terracidiphilus sp.]|nr:hypothetical protein [Terracidiphilus sp.]